MKHLNVIRKYRRRLQYHRNEQITVTNSCPSFHSKLNIETNSPKAKVYGHNVSQN